MPLEMVRLAMEALNRAGKCLRGSRVVILGITYKPGVRDIQATPTLPIINELTERGADITLCDPVMDGTTFQGYQVTGNIEAAIKAADCIIVVTAHKEFKELHLDRAAQLSANPLIIVDGRGIYREVVKPERTIYVGIGIPFR